VCRQQWDSNRVGRVGKVQGAPESGAPEFNGKKLLIICRIIKFVATRCHILRPKYAKFNFGWGSAEDPAGRAYSAPPDSLAGVKGGLLLREGKG